MRPRWRIIPCLHPRQIRLGYCFTPYQRLWLYNGAPLVAFYDTLGIRRTYFQLKPPASSRGIYVRREMLELVSSHKSGLLILDDWCFLRYFLSYSFVNFFLTIEFCSLVRLVCLCPRPLNLLIWMVSLKVYLRSGSQRHRIFSRVL